MRIADLSSAGHFDHATRSRHMSESRLMGAPDQLDTSSVFRFGPDWCVFTEANSVDSDVLLLEGGAISRNPSNE